MKKVKVQVYILYKSHAINGSLISSLPTWNIEYFTFEYPEFEYFNQFDVAIRQDLHFKLFGKDNIEAWFLKTWDEIE